MMAQSSPSIWTSSTPLRSDRSNILKLPSEFAIPGAQFHLFHSAAPNLKRELKTAPVADKPKTRHENLTRSSAYPTSPRVNADRTRQRICDANAIRIDSGQCLERNAYTISPFEFCPETRSAIP